MTTYSARLFCGSLESAIYLLSSICEVPASVSVIPAISTNFSHHISAILEDGTIIVGQNAISHPSDPTAIPSASQQTTAVPTRSTSPNPNGQDGPNADTRYEVESADAIEDANLPGSLPTLRKQYIAFSKKQGGDDDNLSSRIDTISYINPYGQQIRPAANPKIIETLREAGAIVYSIGSLYTSIIPCLVLRGVGEAIATGPAQAKILLLNGSLDRESGPSWHPLDAMDFVRAIAKASNGSRGAAGKERPFAPSRFVTHLVYLEGTGAPAVDRQALLAAGIEPVRVYGRRAEDGNGCRYDENALTQALAFCIGGRTSTRTERSRSRRNTLES